MQKPTFITQSVNGANLEGIKHVIAAVPGDFGVGEADGVGGVGAEAGGVVREPDGEFVAGGDGGWKVKAAGQGGEPGAGSDVPDIAQVCQHRGRAAMQQDQLERPGVHHGRTARVLDLNAVPHSLIRSKTGITEIYVSQHQAIAKHLLQVLQSAFTNPFCHKSIGL